MLIILSISSFAQTSEPFCGTDELYKKDPRARIQAIGQIASLNGKAAVDPNTVLTLPVVFVVYHLGEAVGTGSNLSDTKLNEELAKLNDAFRARNTFAGLNDSKIQFARAQYDDNCASTNGIVRVNASGVPGYATTELNSGEHRAMLGSLRALHNWNNRDEYITIELVRNLNGGGYGGLGLLVINSSSYWYGLAAHEMGHCLNLGHTFDGDNGGTQCPPNDNPETDGDMVSDTDPHKSDDTCLGINSSESSINPCSGVPFGTLLSNFMSYSISCWKKFTPGQIERMRNSIATFKPKWINSRALTGITPPPIANAVEQCSTGTVTLTASACVGTYKWYETASGGNAIGNSATFTTTSLVASTTYYVTCTAGGGCTESSRFPVAVTIKPPVIANGCTPTAIHGTSELVGISAFLFNTIKRTEGQSSASIGSNYSDLSCSVSTIVQAGNTYPFTLNSLFGFPVFARIYIDFNNNGDLSDAGELVYSGSRLATHSGNITIPSSAVINTGLRMRVMIAPKAITPCSLTGYDAGAGSGRAEDFAITLTPNSNPCPSTITHRYQMEV